MDFADALDHFPAIQLRATLAIVKRIIAWSDEQLIDGNVLTSLPISKLVDTGLLPTQVRDAVAVFQKVHEVRYGSVTDGGIESQPPPRPTLRDTDGTTYLRGLMWIPLAELDRELSHREGVAPSGKAAIKFDTSGIYEVDPPFLICDLTAQEHRLLRYIFSHPECRLKKLATDIGAEESNTVRCMRAINRKFSARMGSPIILHQVSGYFVDKIRFAVSGA